MNASVIVSGTGKAQLQVSETPPENVIEWFAGELVTRFNIDTTNDNYGVRTAESDYKLLCRVADAINAKQASLIPVKSV